MDKSISCPLEHTMNFLSGKWKPVILWHLSQHSVLRYGELKKALGTITDKMLSQQLKELEKDGFVHREAYPEIPPKVEYSLTARGASLQPVLESMSRWGEERLEEKV